jgi:hypothetical protein
MAKSPKTPNTDDSTPDDIFLLGDGPVRMRDRDVSGQSSSKHKILLNVAVPKAGQDKARKNTPAATPAADRSPSSLFGYAIDLVYRGGMFLLVRRGGRLRRLVFASTASLTILLIIVGFFLFAS